MKILCYIICILILFKEVIILVKKEQGIVKENLRGGKGSVEIFHILSADELMGHGKMYA